MAGQWNRGGRRTRPEGARPRNWDAGGIGPTSVYPGGYFPSLDGPPSDPPSLHPFPPHASRPPLSIGEPPALVDLLISASHLLYDLLPAGRVRIPTTKAELARSLSLRISSGADPMATALAAALLRNDLVLHQALAAAPGDRAIRNLVDEVGAVEFGGAYESRDAFDECRQYVVSVRITSGEEITLLATVSRLGGPKLVNAFIADIPISQLRAIVRRESQLRLLDTPAAEVWASITGAIARTDRVMPPIGTKTWPAQRFAVEWLLGALPVTRAKRRRDEPPPTSRPDVDRFIVEFLRCGQRRSLDLSDDAIGSVLLSLLWYKDEFTNDDRDRWGPEQVENLLTDWALAKLTVPDTEIALIPDVLRALVPWCHSRLHDLEPRHTTKVLDAIDQFEPVFRDRLIPGRVTGVDALIERAMPYLYMGRDAELVGEAMDELDIAESRGAHEILDLWQRAACVGSVAALDQLTAEPLPEGEAPDLSAIKEPYRQLVGHIASEAGAIAALLFGDEVATSASRIAVRVGRLKPKALERGDQAGAIAAIVWMSASANGLTRRNLVSEIKEAAGTRSNPKQRARTLLKVLGRSGDTIDPVALGSPDLLTGRRRQTLIHQHSL